MSPHNADSNEGRLGRSFAAAAAAILLFVKPARICGGGAFKTTVLPAPRTGNK